jgi:thiol-disulfide isomerase/thioredoxin
VRKSFERSGYLNRLQLVILLPLLFSGQVDCGWLEAMSPAHGAPPLMLKDLQGIPYQSSELKGKTMLINFWATWCPPCIEEMPSLIRLNEEMGRNGLVVLAVNVEEHKRRVSKIAARLKLTFPVLLDSKRVVADAWDVRVFPSSFLVDAQGRLRYRAIGPVAWDSEEVSSIVRQLLQE